MEKISLNNLGGKFKTRPIYLQAECHFPGFEFDTFHPYDKFMIFLQSKFVQDETTALLLKILGNIKDQEIAGVKR